MFCFVLAAPLAVCGSDSRPLVSAMPELTLSQKEFLSKVARRSIRDAVLRRPNYTPEYVPAQLTSMEYEAIVRVRDHGYVLAFGAAGPAPLAMSVRDAAVSAGALLKGEAESPTAELSIEIEIVGAIEEIPVPANWTEPRTLDPYIEPGVHGVILEASGRTQRICPTEFITSEKTIAEVMADLAPLVQKSGAQAQGLSLGRFRTVHWYEPAANAPIIALHRGMTLVKSEDVSPQSLDDAIGRLAEYMIYRQRPTGFFTYQFESSKDRYTAEENYVRQAGAATAMALHARVSGKSASAAAASIAIDRELLGWTAVPGRDDAAFLRTPDERNKLGVTALCTLAMIDHPDSAKYADRREKLINGMLWLQRPSGMFVTAFPPAVELESQDYFPGEALLAMARHYQESPSAKVLEAFDLAHGFYRGYFRESPSPAFVPWQVQAYSIMAQLTKRKDFADFVFEMTDWLASMQMTKTDCEWPDLWGGVSAYQKGRSGVSTAAYLEGFADALDLARQIGDVERTKRYEPVVRDAARFVLQLQVRPEEAYFVRSPHDAVWGIRTAPGLNLLRIDHCQHALVGLIKARKALFPS